MLDHERLRIESHDIKLNDGTVVRDWLWVDEVGFLSALLELTNEPLGTLYCPQLCIRRPLTPPLSWRNVSSPPPPPLPS